MSIVGSKKKIKIPIVDLLAQYQQIKSEIDATIKDVIESGKFILGPNVEAFESELQAYLDCQHVVSCANGTDAIMLALKALDIGNGDEVITVSHSYYATSEAIVNVGATPVFVDVLERDFNIDVSKIEKAITKHTKAIIPVHIYGQPCEITKVIEIAKSHGLYVIEDCAQSLGATYNSKQTGTFGTIGTTSFYPTKNLGAYGDGGAIFTNDPSVAEKLKLLRAHGLSRRYVHDLVGVNSRLDELQAAVLRVKLKYLNAWNKKRFEAANYYNKILGAIAGIKTPIIKANCTHIFHQYTIMTSKRDLLSEELNELGIDTLMYYPIPIHKQKPFEVLLKNNCHLPVTEKLCGEILSLPMYPEITREAQDYVAKKIQDIML